MSYPPDDEPPSFMYMGIMFVLWLGFVYCTAAMASLAWK